MPPLKLPYKFDLRDYQKEVFKAFFVDKKKRFVNVWHRRAGKDKMWLNITIASALRQVGTYAYLLPTLRQARKVIWEGIDKDGMGFIDHFPSDVISKINNTDMTIKLVNGSIFRLGGADYYNALMGTNPIGIVFSEYSLQNPLAWHYLRPILAENGGWASFVYTPRGTNHGFKLYEDVKNDDEWFCNLLTSRDTIKNEGGSVISEEVIEAEKRAGMSENMVEQEFYCSFTAAIEGAYFAKQLAQAERDKRICNFAIDTSLPVNTYWDIGTNDTTAIWLVQRFRNEYRAIGYYENNNSDLVHYINWLDTYRTKQQIRFERHYGPHDIAKREFSSNRSIIDTARNMGFRFEIVPRIAFKPDAIEAARSIFSRVWFHQDNCAQGLAALREYRSEYNERLGTYASKPLHNWASNGADAFMQLAQTDRTAMENSQGLVVHKNRVNQRSVFK